MRGATLLVVEDQAVVAADLKERLLRSGYQVCGIAASGEEALGLARRHRPQLALMDIRLQGAMDGIDTAARLRRELDVAVIFLSAYSDEATLRRARQSDSFGFLIKPFDDRELQFNIDMALHKQLGERALLAAHREICHLNASLEARVRERTAELEAALGEIEGFVDAAAHHLRSPLRAMEGYAALLARADGVLLPEAVAHFPQAIASGAQQVGRLVDELLGFINLRRQPLSLQTVDIAAIARGALDAQLAADTGRSVRTRIGPLPACLADPALLRQLFDALLSNAFKFSRTRQPACIAIEAGAAPARVAGSAELVSYFVRDNGIGIDTAYADRLFTLFSRLNLPEQFDGTGAGLASARRIVERMGGTLRYDPTPGGGATFSFTLPRSI